ncbi:hypothetical protein FACS1894202_08450 [Clostridia bacterium]|nr:hypothetical protein FACS1894202_08450 [Clostridia bacterium]
MTVMLDTNVLISAGIFGENRFSELTLRISDEYELVLSSRIIDELWTVMKRKFPNRQSSLEKLLKRLSYTISYTPSEIDEEIYPKIRDKNDYPILASAIIADVDVLVTGDKDFGGLDLERPEIMTLAEFGEKYLR